MVYCPVQACRCGVSFVLTIGIRCNDRYRKLSLNIDIHEVCNTKIVFNILNLISLNNVCFFLENDRYYK